MVNDDEFDYILENSQRVLRLNDQYENHPYVEEFTKDCSVMFVYRTCVLEGEADAKFSLSEIWKLFQEDPLPNNVSNFCRQMINCMKAWNYIQKTLGSPLGTEIIKQTHKIMMEHRKDILVREYIKLSVFACYHIFVPAGHIERYMEDAIFRFHETKKMIQLWPLQICLIHPFEDGNGRICCLILAHGLIQMKCCLFPVILSFFHRRGRRHYIRAVKMFYGKP